MESCSRFLLFLLYPCITIPNIGVVRHFILGKLEGDNKKRFLFPPLHLISFSGSFFLPSEAATECKVEERVTLTCSVCQGNLLGGGKVLLAT